MNYTLKIEYRHTKDFGQAGGLSRLPSSEELFDKRLDEQEVKDELFANNLISDVQMELPVTAKGIAEETKKDIVLSKVKKSFEAEWPAECREDKARPFFEKRTEISNSYGCLLWELRRILAETGRTLDETE